VPLQPGAEAPAFELPSSDGEATSLDDIAGDGPVLLAFFKTGCPTCQTAFPVYAELERRYGAAVPVAAVSQDSLAKTVPWLRDKGFAGVALDDQSDGYAVSAAYAVTTVPTLVLVEAGTVVDVTQGWDRDRVNALARDLGERTGGDTSAVSTEGDGRPAFKPG
jgi:peroxiredoxin